MMMFLSLRDPARRVIAAATLSFLVPGAGLWLLGRPGLAVVNLVVATAFVFGLWLIASGPLSDYFHYVLLVTAAASAGIAHAFGRRPILDSLRSS